MKKNDKMPIVWGAVISLTLVMTATFLSTYFIKKQIKTEVEQNLTEGQMRASVPQLRKIAMGYSLGMVQGTDKYSGAMQSAIKWGAKSIRVFEPFSRFTDTNTAMFANFVKYYVDQGAEDVVITIGGNAFSKLSEDTAGNKYTQLQKKFMAYTNRAYPKDTAAHRALIIKLVNELKKKYVRYDYKMKDTIFLIRYCSFEVGDESDAERYYWGTLPQLKALNKIRYEACLTSGRPVATGSYTTSILADSSFKQKGEVSKYLSTDNFFSGRIFSHSFYWINSSSKNDSDYFNLSSNDYPHRSDVPEVWVTEYNLFASFDKNKRRETICNSREYGYRMYLFLNWCYNNKVKKVFIHPLCVGGIEESSVMGAYDILWNAQQHVNHYVLKPYGYAQMDIIQVVANGFFPIPNGLQGTTKKIIFNPDKSYTITNI